LLDWQCVNPVCGNHHVGKSGLVSATRFDGEYYGVEEDEENGDRIK
jgi:hypothetical protein